MSEASLGWLRRSLRLGLVQTGLGAIVVLTTSTLNRVMVVELALPAMLPGACSSRRCITPCRCCARAVLVTAPISAAGGDAVDRRRHGGVLALGGVRRAALGDRADGDASDRGAASRLRDRLSFIPDRHRRRRGRHRRCWCCSPSGVDAWPRRRAGRDHRVGDDDRGLHRSPRRSPAASSIRSRRRASSPSSARCRRIVAFARDARRRVWGIEGRARQRLRAIAPADARTRESAVPRRARASLERTARRGASRSSCSSRCWPTARRNC